MDETIKSEEEGAAEEVSQGEVTLSGLVNELAQQRGLDLRGYKHGTLGRRLRKRMGEIKVANYREYLGYIQQHPNEINELLNSLLINVTEFFRDPQAWEVMRAEILPQMLKGMEPGDSFRAWCTGCATGEEAYSLAILLADHFGESLPEYDVKIYATDVDEDALNVARRAEYPTERLRRVKPEWREKYFYGDGTLRRIHRELRRMLIFGRNNLLADAPISHCHLVVCRNVLIYFDADAQTRILSRLYYALEPEGVLFLGKAETKLSESRLFRVMNYRWRVFQKISPATEAGSAVAMAQNSGDGQKGGDQESNRLRVQERFILETIKSGIIMLDSNDIILSHNDAASNIWGVRGVRLAGRRLQNTELFLRCPELAPRLADVRSSGQQVKFECSIKHDSEERLVEIELKPMGDGESRIGILMHCEDVTDHDKLQATVEQLEATGEELQSANEELETTNEELQSTNEELETTNEELQSTNEELETTNEELQSLNEELENLNDELEHRSAEVNQVSSRYADTLQRMPWPVMLLDKEKKVQLWNAAVQRLFGVSATSVVGVDLDRLPVEDPLRKILIRRSSQALLSRKAAVVRNQPIKGSQQTCDIHFTPLATPEGREGLLVMFGSFNLPSVAKSPQPAKAKSRGAKAGRGNPGRKKKR